MLPLLGAFQCSPSTDEPLQSYQVKEPAFDAFCPICRPFLTRSLGIFHACCVTPLLPFPTSAYPPCIDVKRASEVLITTAPAVPAAWS